jgi:hypothetical protein
MANVLAAYFTTLQSIQPETQSFLHSSARFSSTSKNSSMKRRYSVKEMILPSLHKFKQIKLDNLYDPKSDNFFTVCRSSRRQSPLQCTRTNIITPKQASKECKKEDSNIKHALCAKAYAMRSLSNNRILNSNSRKLLHFIDRPVQWKFVVDGARFLRTTNEFIVARSEEMMRTIRHPKWNVPGKEVVIEQLIKKSILQ